MMTLGIALKALGRNKMRTGLTMLGMIIGVAAVISLVAMGNGAQSAIESQIKGAGTNMITVTAGNFTSGGVRQGTGAATSLTAEDAEAIRREVAGVQYLAAGASTRGQVVAGNQNWSTRVQGTDVDLTAIRAWTVERGAFFTEQDVRSAAKIAVLGTTVSEQLFGEGVDPTGQMIRIGKQPFRVIGVMASKGQGMGDDTDDQILVPYTTVQKKLLGVTYINSITVSAASADETSAVADRIALLLRARHGIGPGRDDDFTVRTLDEIADLRSQATGTMTTLLAGIAGVSLVVGGIGIMNIMLVSVTERTREIGLRMAVGAKPMHILFQFLIEALALSTIGGLVGVGGGVFGAMRVAAALKWPMLIRVDVIVVAVAFSALVGVIFGLYPAYKASKLDPIEALRYE
jgi:putative ABC transport system permease protein